MTSRDPNEPRVLSSVLRLLCSVLVVLGLSACGLGDDVDPTDPVDDAQFRSSELTIVEHRNVIFRTNGGWVELSGSDAVVITSPAAQYLTPQTKWDLRTRFPKANGCIEHFDAVYIGPTMRSHYSPLGIQTMEGSRESWRLEAVSIASNDGCLAPGDQFKLRSNLGGSYLADGQVLTLDTHDDYELFNHTVAAELDFDGVSAFGGTLSVNAQKTVVFLPTPLVDPVVIVGPASFVGSDPVTVQVSSVYENVFEVRLLEWEYGDQTHAKETISFVVFEAGVHQTNNGSTIEAGSFWAEGDSEQRTARDFAASFSAAPMIFTSSQTGYDPVAVRVDSLGPDAFDVVLDDQEANQGSGSDHYVGYLAIEGAPADTQTQTHLLTQAAVDENWIEVAGVELMFQEEQSADSETNHALETVHVLGVTLAGFEILLAQDVGYAGPDTATIRWRAL